MLVAERGRSSSVRTYGTAMRKSPIRDAIFNNYGFEQIPKLENCNSVCRERTSEQNYILPLTPIQHPVCPHNPFPMEHPQPDLYMVLETQRKKTTMNRCDGGWVWVRGVLWVTPCRSSIGNFQHWRTTLAIPVSMYKAQEFIFQLRSRDKKRVGKRWKRRWESNIRSDELYQDSNPFNILGLQTQSKVSVESL